MATKTVRAPMPRSRRAKQFMPFDALSQICDIYCLVDAIWVCPNTCATVDTGIPAITMFVPTALRRPCTGQVGSPSELR